MTPEPIMTDNVSEQTAAAKVICTRIYGDMCMLVHNPGRPPCTDENCRVWPIARAALTAAAQVRERAKTVDFDKPAPPLLLNMMSKMHPSFQGSSRRDVVLFLAAKYRHDPTVLGFKDADALAASLASMGAFTVEPGEHSRPLRREGFDENDPHAPLRELRGDHLRVGPDLSQGEDLLGMRKGEE